MSKIIKNHGLSFVMALIAIAQAFLIAATAYVIFFSPNKIAVGENTHLMAGSFDTEYMTIILSLITLCATLAVVIPYLIGKIYIESQVKEDIQKEINGKIDKYIFATDSQVQKNLNAMDLESAHFSRMISYLLLQQAKAEKSQKIYGWTIGWAAKAIRLYLHANQKEYHHFGNFMGNCFDYIKEAGNALPDTMKDDDKAIISRAIGDLYMAYLLLRKENSLDKTGEEKIREILKKMLKAIPMEMYEFKQEVLETISKKIFDFEKFHNSATPTELEKQKREEKKIIKENLTEWLKLDADFWEKTEEKEGCWYEILSKILPKK